MSESLIALLAPPAEGFNQAHFLQALVQAQHFVTFYLINGIQLQGYVIGHDPFILLIKGPLSKYTQEMGVQLIYKQAIATIVVTESRAAV